MRRKTIRIALSKKTDTHNKQWDKKHPSNTESCCEEPSNYSKAQVTYKVAGAYKTNLSIWKR